MNTQEGVTPKPVQPRDVERIMNDKTQIILYQTKDEKINIRVHVDGETVWLTQKQMAELFDVSIPTINEHLKTVFSTGELEENSVIRNFRITAADGKSYDTKHYQLDAIISIGYRINSVRGTQFRMWATARLREYIIKGFTMDDDRLKEGGGRARYFEELLQRVRDIRSSERNFYQKVTDIYATSIDYKKDSDLTNRFFATVQNKMHFAVHGHTAAEIISLRADAQRPLMGLTSFKGNYITAADTHSAKNYLSEPEITQLNLIVAFYLDFAELQAFNGRSMKMEDWIKKLDEFLVLSEKNILVNSGTISAKAAEIKANMEFDRYRKDWDKNYLSDFDHEVKKLKK